METLRARVRRSVDVSENGCWLWRLRLDRHGYGAMHLDGRTRLAHRVAYEAFVGPIPDGLTLDHTCRVRHCVNPDHLDPCTTGENTARIPRDATCRNGHPRTEANTYLSPRGDRTCIDCREYWKRKAKGLATADELRPPNLNPAARGGGSKSL